MKDKCKVIKFSFSIILAFFFLNCHNNSNKGNNPKVIVIGLDGANWDTLDPLIKKGKLPFFKKLKENSAWGYCKTFKPTKSPIIWTSIATGKTMEKHGIVDFAYVKKNKIKIPFTNIENRAQSLWNILTKFKKRSVVLNWWVTYPPDQINGVMVSGTFRNSLTQSKDYLETYKDTVFPSEYFDQIKIFREEKYGQVINKTPLVDYINEYSKLYPEKSFKKVTVLKLFKMLAKQEYLINRTSDYLYEKELFDFFAVYYRMPDVVQHFALKLFPPEKIKEIFEYISKKDLDSEKKEEILDRISDILLPAYEYMENIVKSMMTSEKYKDAYFMIMSDHGFHLGHGGYNHYGLPGDVPPPDGILILKGPDVINKKLENVSVFDVAPTALYIFGLPVGKNMDGRIITEAFKNKRPVSYKIYKNQPKKFKKADKKKIDQKIKNLKSMGYIE